MYKKVDSKSCPHSWLYLHPLLTHFLIKLYHLNILQGNDSSSSIFLGLWVIAIVINTDIGGYIFEIMGKTVFHCSPNKTYEGAYWVLFSVWRA